MPNTDRERILEFLRAHKEELRKQFGVTRRLVFRIPIIV